MSERQFILFRRTKEVEIKISEFLSNIIHSGFLFSLGFEIYLDKGATAEFENVCEQVSAHEAKNDELRRAVEIGLYAQMILPDVRSDILRLLEGCDRVINAYEENMLSLSVEQIAIPVAYRSDIHDLLEPTAACADALIEAVRCFFSGMELSEYAQKISFFEHEIDLQTAALKRKIFSDKKMDLAHKMQLRDMINRIETVSDRAEDVSDRLQVVAVKHSL